MLDTPLLDIALEEDLGVPYCDITSSLLFADVNKVSTAKVISKHPTPITICGLPIVNQLIKKLDGSLEIQTKYQDGQTLLPGEVLLTLTGSPKTLLMLERTMLNFLQHLSAVSTLTAKFVDLIKHTQTKILDTRKTLPGFRRLEKYAVQCGGGVNHRMGLYDAIMIKDTHIDALGNIHTALSKLPENILEKCPVIVEIRSLSELETALSESRKISRVLLDNMTPDLLSQCVKLCKNKLPTEASGNINLNTVVSVAETGVDFISVGKITHSAENVDLSMRCEI
ncbi:MAG TPA: carboxylating nicotinate-nucleotide diphosphorylase [Gammaproteobacteria bacterium]|nr:carboxylating nicotinate-nucleotide diphosphorylase [Gammaproteobacteria bacterium]